MRAGDPVLPANLGWALHFVKQQVHRPDGFPLLHLHDQALVAVQHDLASKALIEDGLKLLPESRGHLTGSGSMVTRYIRGGSKKATSSRFSARTGMCKLMSP